MTIRNAILSHYPLSKGFSERLAPAAADAICLSIAELRRLPLHEMVVHLRAVKVDTLFLPVEDDNAGVLLPVLKLLAVLVPARATCLIDGELRVTPIRAWEAIPSLFRLFGASVVARAALMRARGRARRLLREPLLIPSFDQNGAVLYLNANLWFGVKAGGSVGHISGVANALIARGLPLDFASAGGRLMVRQDAPYIPLHPPSSFGFPWETNYYRFHYSVVDQLAPLRGERRYRFIYQRMSLANFSGVELSRAWGVPLILEYNGSEAWVAKNWGTPLRHQQQAEDVEALCLRHAHVVVTISDVLRDELLERGVPAERIVVYPNCIDPTIFDPARFSAADTKALRGRLGIPQDACLITFVGTFGQWHGVEVLARAIKLLLDQDIEWIRANQVHFLLVGDGVKMPEVRAVLGGYTEGGHVTLAGLVPQHVAPLYLAASDILSSPHVANADGTRFFGSPTKLFEYMAMGKAIVASDLDQIGQVLANSLKASELPSKHAAARADLGELAVLSRPGDELDHARGLRFLVECPEIRKRLGCAARAEALARYTWDAHVRVILDSFASNMKSSG